MLSSATLGSLLLTDVDADGIQWGVTGLDGWGASAGTISPQQKPRQDGAWAGWSYRKPRSIVLSGQAVLPSSDAATLAVDKLVSAASLDETTLTIVESGASRYATVRRDGEVVAKWTPGAGLIFDWSIQLVAVDPRKFGAELSASTNLPSTTGGLTIPFTIPFAINAVQVSGDVSLTNPGNVTGPVTLRIDGPCVGPSITHVGPGGLVQTVALAAYSMGVGEFLTVDMEARQVLAQGQASRAGFLTSRQWFGFEPGVNLFAFTATSYNPGTLLTVTASPTWG